MLSRVSSRALVGTALAVQCCLLVTFRDEAFISNDGCQYLSVARNLSMGKGLSTSIAYYEEHYRLGGVPVPQTVFPPGFPALIAAFTQLGLSAAFSAFLISLLSFVLCAWVLYDLAETRGYGPGRAALLSAIWMVTVMGWDRVLTGSSEIPFILCTLVSLKYLRRDPGRESPFLAGLAAASAITIRYAGVFYLAAVVLVLGIELVRDRSRPALRRLALVVWPPLIALAALFLRNALLVGDLKGGNDHAPHHTLLDLARTYYFAFSGFFGFDQTGLVGFRPPEILLVASLISLAALLIAARGVSRARVASAWQRDRVLLVSAAYVGATFLLLSYLEFTSSIGLSRRFLLPLWPFVLLIAPEILARLRPNERPAVPLLSATRALIAAAFVAGQLVLLDRLIFGEGVARNRSLRAAFANRELRERLAEEGRAGRPVLSNQPQQVAEILQQPVLGLAEHNWTSRVWTADEVLTLARAYGVRLIVFHPGTFTPSRNQTFFGDLAGGNVPGWLENDPVSSDLSLYRLTDAAANMETVSGR